MREHPNGTVEPPPGPHTIYECVAEGEGPWLPGEFVGLTATDPVHTIVRMSKDYEPLAVYGCAQYPVTLRDVFAGRLHLRWAAPAIRRMRQEEMTQSLSSVPEEMLDALRLLG